MDSQSLTIDPPRSTAEFLDAPRALYAADPHFVPPLTSMDRRQLEPRQNPFFEQARARFVLARRGGRVVGRISAVRNLAHDAFHGDQVGFFGHFEAADADVAQALLAHAAAWLAADGATVLRGPIDLSTNYRCGLLVEGEAGTPYVMMPHNPPQYASWLEAFGLQPAKDLLALRLTTQNVRTERLERVLAKLASRAPAARFRPIELRRFRQETEVLWSLYNRIWERNWGFVPMSEREFLAEARSLKPVCVPDLLQIVEVEGRPAGFTLALPDVNLAIKACDGRLWPFGWWRFMRTLKRVTRMRVLTLGLLPEYRKTGVDALMLQSVMQAGLRCGFVEAEGSWVLEDNVAMRRPLETMGAEPYRRYRIYERPL